jgi:hypothetical protein
MAELQSTDGSFSVQSDGVHAVNPEDRVVVEKLESADGE